MRKIYLEISLHDPTDAEGYIPGIIHIADDCPAILRVDKPNEFRDVWSCLISPKKAPDQTEFNIKIGRGAWVKVRNCEAQRCKACLAFSVVCRELDAAHYSETGSWLGVELPNLANHLKVTQSEVLRAMRRVANIYGYRPGEKPCESCGMPIRFKKNEKGKSTPHDRSGDNHFIACPNREAHRRK